MSSHNTKTAVRERMASTGENYTTARRALTSEAESPPVALFYAQYVRTNAPQVLEALHQRISLGRYVAQERVALARECNGQEGFFVSSRGEVPDMTALAGEKPSTGRWKKAARGKGWAPAEGNPVKGQWDSLARIPEPSVPGMPQDFLLGPYIWNVRPFLHDGYAWVGLHDDPSKYASGPVHSSEAFAPPWEIVRGSDYLRAVEDYNDSVRGKPRPPATEGEIKQGQAIFERIAREKKERAEERQQWMADAMLAQRHESPLPVRAQFARSTSPEVISAIRKGEEGRAAAREAMEAFARECGGVGECLTSQTWPHLRMLGVSRKPEQSGWTRDRKSGAWRPYKDGYLYRKMRDLSFRAPDVPGVEELQYDAQGERMSAPQVFMAQGAAWAVLEREPGQGSGMGKEWEPVTSEAARFAQEKVSETI